MLTPSLFLSFSPRHHLAHVYTAAQALAADVGLAADLWRDAFATCNL